MIYYKIRYEYRIMDESEYEQDLDFNAKPSLVFDTLE
ncbi:Uncharacterised protein [Streptococcus pneumoniae]|nr:Uncharacterised protein [Streptococcus pneumoniae]VKD47985.1 Uncharacterised protein [Streptococcus pneumoniae]VKG70196.1 Uncharacterised protein [Streptococcus pneumoniae]VKK06016.1 Uncharacterised protein [Streptococcus pneumoniae]VKN47987.1 Uncharacterised protein [Streptococcus pneumoniae]